MNTDELICRFRHDMDDVIKNTSGSLDDAQWSQALVAAYVDDAQNEAAERSKLLFDRTSVPVCHINVTTENTRYSLDKRVLEVQRCFFHGDAENFEVKIYSRVMLDNVLPGWRDETFSGNKAVSVDDTTLELAGSSDIEGQLRLEVYRLPLIPASISGQIEISARNHIYLLDWMKHLAYSKRESDLYSPQLATDHERRFEERFGGKNRAATWQEQHKDVLHTNTVWS
jgi:hypothetical protein